MNPEAANLFSSNSFASEVSPYDVPISSNASPALSALLGQDLTASAAEDQLLKSRLGTVSSLFRALRLKHPPTAKHSLRVAIGCSAFAEHLQLDAEARQQVELSALLHDVGKLGIPDQLLNKADRLNSYEYEVMSQHALFAVHILEALCDDQVIIDNVRYAGHWYDGTKPVGSGIAGDKLPIGARMLAIQNAFDAMTTDTVYRQALVRERAISELYENTPTQFDPKLVSAFCECIGNQDAQFEAGFARHWVDVTNQPTDGIWSFGQSINQVATDPQSIFQQRLLETMHDGVIFVDTSARIMVWNRGAESLTGLSKESVHHKLWEPNIIDMRDVEGNVIKAYACPFLKCLQNTQEDTFRIMITNRGQKKQVAVNAHIMPVRDATGACHGAIMVLHDVSPETYLEERVQNLHTKATRDALTGVANRAEFDRRHEELLETHSDSGEPLGLVICDIDRFKGINDTFGHQAGDAALIDFASLIDTHSRGNDLVARYGGEEFVLICPGCNGDSALQKAEEIRRSLAAKPQPALNNAKMTASFGVTQYQAGDTPESMLKRADEALYQAKSTGRNRVVQLGEGVKPSGSSEKRSWFGWATSKTERSVTRRALRCGVPVQIVAEKIRGFISDNHAELVSADRTSLVVTANERMVPSRRRNNDRPFTLAMHISLKEADDASTVIEVEIKSHRTRNRRRDDEGDRAEQVVDCLKAYLVAEDC